MFGDHLQLLLDLLGVVWVVEEVVVLLLVGLCQQQNLLTLLQNQHQDHNLEFLVYLLLTVRLILLVVEMQPHREEWDKLLLK
jgi:hypothetical protein